MSNAVEGIPMPEIVVWIQTNTWSLIAVAALIVVLLARAAYRRRPVRVDPQRLFRLAQKIEAGERSVGSRCEHKSPLWFRCRNRGIHGDHIYPHSRGGATASSNLQLLCAQHNLRKGSRIPSRLYIWRLERRRLRYFPAGQPVSVVWQIGRAY